MAIEDRVLGYIVRAPKREDSSEVAALVRRVELLEGPDTTYSETDIVEGWDQSTFDLERDAWVVTAEGGEVVAYAELTDAGGDHNWFDAMAWVHPDHRGKGIGSTLVDAYESRSRELAGGAPDGSHIELWAFAAASDEAGLALLATRGFEPSRQFWHMRIDLPDGPMEVSSPQGISIRRFDPDADVETMYRLLEEGFSEHWGFKPTPFEDWRLVMDRADYDPDLWLIADDEGRAVGGLIGIVPAGVGFVRDLAVLKDWRGRGIGAALLERSFNAFQKKGQDRVLLNVDASNETGAVRLYERVGMRVANRFVASVKILRD